MKGRVHVELAASPEEAAAKSIEYLKTWKYTDIEVVACHAETDAEKYDRRFAVWNDPAFNAGENAADGVQQQPKIPSVAQVPAAKAAENADDLF